jgi:uncharacterized protein (DUF4415 family)
MKKKLKLLIDKHGEARELTAADTKLFRRARDVHPELVAAYEAGTLKYRGQRGKQKAPTKKLVSLRVDSDVLDYFRNKGDGWQTRINDVLKMFVDVTR